MKNKTHYVPKQKWDTILYTGAACGLYVCTLIFPVFANLGSTHRKKRVTCKNCKKTKIFRRRK